MADQFEENREEVLKAKSEITHESGSNLADDISEKNDEIIDEHRKIISAFELYDLELEIRKLKRSLENWREIVIPLSSLLKWEQNWYPGALFAGSTILFLVLWLLDPSILTTFAVLGLTLTISDYLVPVLIASIYKSDCWTPRKELEFEAICRSLVIYKTKLHFAVVSYYKMRSDRPKLFYLCTIISLISMAYIGNIFNNLFLTYVFVTSVVLLPGMLHNGLLNKYGSVITQLFSGFVNNLKNKIGHPKTE